MHGLTSCLTGLDLTKQVKLLFIHKSKAAEFTQNKQEVSRSAMILPLSQHSLDRCETDQRTDRETEKHDDSQNKKTVKARQRHYLSKYQNSYDDDQIKQNFQLDICTWELS